MDLMEYDRYKFSRIQNAGILGYLSQLGLHESDRTRWYVFSRIRNARAS